MFMSRLALDPDRRDTQRAMTEPHLLHGAVERAFTGARERRLWRIDRLGTEYWLLIVSYDKPDLQNVQGQFGFPAAERVGESKEYQPFLDRLSTGQRWRFRLKANPVVSVSAEGAEPGSRGKIHAHVTQEQQKKWLLERAAAYGFLLDEDEFDVVHTDWLRFNKGGRRLVTLRAASFEGELRVLDVDRLRETLIRGLGRGKAYGLGLLTLARPQ